MYVLNRPERRGRPADSAMMADAAGRPPPAFRFFSSYVAWDTSPLRALRARYLPTCRSWRGVASRPTYLPTGPRCGPQLIDLPAVRLI